jgi:SRSO17 transposase
MEIPGRELENGINEIMNRIGKVFAREGGYRMGKNYLIGLLSPIERKNGWQMSEVLGKTTPYAIQQFLYRGHFSADSLRDELRGYVSDTMGEEDGVFVVDETGFLKQGKMSCGVKRQYSGTAGRIENCQIGVFLTYSSSKGYAPIDRRLYIPQDWFEDEPRCRKAGIPQTVEFQTKPDMALEMIKEAAAAGFPYQWVTGDCVYGDYTAIRSWLESEHKCYVLSVSGKGYVGMGYKQVRISEMLKHLPQDAWFEASCGDGSKGARLYDWQVVALNSPPAAGWKRYLLVRRSKKNPQALRAYVCCAPEGTPYEKLAQIAGTRWTVERCFAEAKSEVGLDQYEVRSHDGWYKHITFACLALALLSVLAYNSFDKTTAQQQHPSASSLDAFKKGRGLRV